MRILVTGAAGFIGSHLSIALCAQGHEVVGVDNCNSYYDPALKSYRLAKLSGLKNFSFHKVDCTDREGMASLFKGGQFDRVCHLAAQAGVRYSLENPFAYSEANVTGFLVVLECCWNFSVAHLVYASSSSVYGANREVPFAESDAVLKPVSLYAATKRANELMAYTYSHLYGIRTIGLRFFTVYGPMGRPDMAYWGFTESILQDRPIKVFNNGNCKRDFTYIDDIVKGVSATLLDQPQGSAKGELWSLFNIGNDQPTGLLEFIDCIERTLGRKAVRELVPAQPGDVEATWANVDALRSNYAFSPSTPLDSGLKNFVEWYLGEWRAGQGQS